MPAILNIQGEVTESGELRVELPPGTPPGKVVLTLTKSVLPELDREALACPQDATSGVQAILGQWPGDESDDEIFAALDELS